MKLLVFLAGCLLTVALALVLLASGNREAMHLGFDTTQGSRNVAVAQEGGGAASNAALTAKLGVYYFPGWRDRTPHAPSDYPWERIKKYPEREPALGWYDEGDVTVMQSHVNTMADHGLSFVVFDWYWGRNDEVFLEHALRAFQQVPDRRGLQFSLLWANHDGAPASLPNFDRMVAYWITNYFSDASFLRVDGKPVVIVFSSNELDNQATKLGMAPAALLARAQHHAQASGLPGIYFVAGTTSDEPKFKSFSRADSGYSAVTAYNLHWLPGATHASHSYAELDAAYRKHWERYESLGELPVIYPLSSGWDKRPWGGSDDQRHDLSLATPAEFELHLRAGVQAIQRSSKPQLGVICCWNEFGEGSYIEPTRSLGTAVVERVGRIVKSGEAR